jgi:class 3 adenylate cyclase
MGTEHEKKLLFPLFWKLTVFIAVFFSVSTAVVLFTIFTILIPEAEQKARRRSDTFCETSAQTAEAAFNSVTRAAIFFIESHTSADGGGNVPLLFQQNPQIAGIFIYPQNADSAAPPPWKFINSPVVAARAIDWTAFDYFVKTYEADLTAARQGGGGVLSASHIFDTPMLVYVQQAADAYYYCFFLADNILAALEAGTQEDGRRAFLVNGLGGILLQTTGTKGRDAPVSGFPAVEEAAGYMRDIAAGLEASGSRIIKSGAASGGEGGIRGERGGGGIRGGIKRGFFSGSFLTAGFWDAGEHFVSFKKIQTGAVVIHQFYVYDELLDIYSTILRSIFLALALLFITLFAVRIFSKTFFVPLNKLDGLVQEAASCNFDGVVSVKEIDELGRLTNHFSVLLRVLKVISSFAAMPVIRAFLRKELNESLVKKSAVIAHANIVNLPDIKKNTSTADLGMYISQFITIVNDCTEKTLGTAEHFSGSMISCHWGCALTTGNKNHDTLNAVRAVLMMRIGLIDFNRGQKQKNKPPLQVSFSIDAGVVSAGISGGNIRKEYTVFGNTVKASKNIVLLNRFDTADIIITEKILLRIQKFVISQEMPDLSGSGKRYFAVINLKTEEGVTQPVPRNLTELRKLLDSACEDTDGNN